MLNQIELPKGFRLLHLPETGSTNDDCLAKAQQGEPEGLVIVADAQSKGRGRQGRAWFSQPGNSLTFTVLLRPSALEQTCSARFTALGGLALVTCLKQDFGVPAQLKWPNDVLINSRKTCGILAETSWRGSQLEAVVLGMGVNILSGAVPAQGNLNYPATSIQTETGLSLDRWNLLYHLLARLSELRQYLPKAEFIDQWNQNLAFKGQLAFVRDDDGEKRQYRIHSVQEDGGLLVSAADGSQRKVVHSGEFCPPSFS